MKYKIFEGKTLQEAINKAFSEEYDIATIKQIGKAIKSKKVLDQGYDSSIAYINYRIRKATKEELKHLKSFYSNGGRLLFIGLNSYYIVLNGYFNLDFDARFVGVKK